MIYIIINSFTEFALQLCFAVESVLSSSKTVFVKYLFLSVKCF